MGRGRYRILFGLAIVTLVALSAWWTVLIGRFVRAEREAAVRELELRVELGREQDPADARRAIDERHARRVLMVAGEGGLMFVLVGVCVLMLLRLARGEQRQVRAMRRFISTVTHEMKSPLAGIKSLLETAAAGNVPPERRAELMSMGIAEAERLEHMIENVLVAGRLRTDLQPIRMALTRLEDVVDPFVEHRRRLLADPGALEVAFGEGTRGLEVLVDPDSLRIVLENLVDNAFKYGGRQPQVRLGCRIDADRVRIDVTDGGEGFEPQEAESLFAPFHRAGRDAGTARHGTGLGLSIARALARRMGGELTASSEGAGRGATFSLLLPGRPR
jgi:histidine kinase